MSKRNQRIGQWGENMAAAYLEQQGFFIRARNVRTPYGEIDLIVQKEGFIHFIEVKTRTGSQYGPPEVAVTPRKQEHMLATADHYAGEHEIDHWQIDVLAVEGKPGQIPKFTYFENVLG